jgi:hypothetical protein
VALAETFRKSVKRPNPMPLDFTRNIHEKTDERANALTITIWRGELQARVRQCKSARSRRNDRGARQKHVYHSAIAGSDFRSHARVIGFFVEQVVQRFL